MGPMTQQRSRILGRVLMAAGVVKIAWWLRGLVRWPLVVSIPLALITLPVAALALWTGYTLATMDWDDPADYPPPAPAAEDPAL